MTRGVKAIYPIGTRYPGALILVTVVNFGRSPVAVSTSQIVDPFVDQGPKKPCKYNDSENGIHAVYLYLFKILMSVTWFTHTSLSLNTPT